MSKKITFVFLLISSFVVAQQTKDTTLFKSVIVTPEIMAGVTAEANVNFPDHSFQKQIMLSFGWEHDNTPQEWAQRLKGPRTGIGFGYENFGNKDTLGSALTLMPFIEFNAFRKEKLKVQLGMGGSYFNKKYDSILNPKNQAVTTDLTWSFRAFINYQFISSEKIDWRVGAGYFHHSNGHTRLANQGYNSFLISLSADIKNNKRDRNFAIIPDFDRSIYSYFTFRSGYGINAFSKAFNDKKSVYTISAEYGKVLNNTFKLGVGFYYRFYEHYYDYIVNNESLVQDGREFDYYKEHPWRNASNLGLFIKGEVLLNHFGIDFQLGVNLYKPGYRIDWRINQGWSYVPRVIPEQSGVVLGEFDSKFKKKKLISSHLGLKYYLFGNERAPKNNFFIGMFLNTNLGQADFSEVSVGYVYSFNFKKRS